jgi:flagellar hook-associated protein 3 FlgL
MMQISTANSRNVAIDQLMVDQNSMNTTQQQLTSGFQVNAPSDNPAAAAVNERILADEAHITSMQAAANASNNAMTLSETALASATSLLQSINQDIVEAGNATLSASDRQSLATGITQLRNQLLSVANSTDGNGSYLFAGQASSQPPFVDAAGGVQYHGTNSQTYAAAGQGMSLPLTLNGQSAFMQAPSGNGVFATSALVSTGSAWIDPGSVTNAAALTGATYQINFSVSGGNTTYSVLKNGAATPQTNVAFQSGQAVQVDGMSAVITGQPANGDEFQLAPSTPSLSVFDVIDKTIADLNTPGLTSAQISQDNSTNLQNLNQCMTQVSAAQSVAGSAVNRISEITSQLSAQTLADQTQDSNAVDVNETQALSTFSTEQTGYQAALKAYSLIQGLSLFNYLSSSSG